MLFDQIAKLAVQILRPEPAIGLSHFPSQWADSTPLRGRSLGSRGAGGADQYGPIPDSIEV